MNLTTAVKGASSNTSILFYLIKFKIIFLFFYYYIL
jgi:hypothetical protein